MRFYEQQARNRRRTAQLVVGHATLFFLLGIGVDAALLGFPVKNDVPYITLAALALSLAVSAFGYYRGDRALLRSLMAQPINETDREQRQLANVVREISIAAGIPAPDVYLIPDRAPNALATGRSPQHASLAFTAGALALLDREETQGVVAHEIAHIASGDTTVLMMVSILFGSAIMLADWSRRMLFFSRMSLPAMVFFSLPLFLLAIVTPALSRLLAVMVSRQRETLADAKAVELTRNPAGLAGALRKIRHTRSPLRGATRGTAHLFIVNPLLRSIDEEQGRWADLFATHPPLDYRIDLLEGRAS